MASMNMLRVAGTATVCANVYVFSRWHFRPKVDRDPNDKSGVPPPVDPVKTRKHQQYMCNNWAISLQNINEGRWWTVIASSFSHESGPHLALSLWALYQNYHIMQLIGVGAPRVIALGLGSGVAGAAAFLLDCTTKPAPQRNTRCLGASGALSGLFTGAMLMTPKLPMGIPFVPHFSVPFRKAMLVFLSVDLGCLVWENAQGERLVFGGNFVSYASHLGGALFGAAFYAVALRKYGPAALPRNIPRPRPRPRPRQRSSIR